MCRIPTSMKPKASTVNNFTSPKPIPDSFEIRFPAKENVVKIVKIISPDNSCEKRLPMRID